MTGPALRLRPATPAEFDEWLPRQMANYTEMITESGSLAPAEARRKAERGRPLPLREPRLRGHGTADEEAAVSGGRRGPRR